MEQFADDQQIVKTLSVNHRECSKHPLGEMAGPGAKWPFISASRPIRSETGEADLLLRAIENLSDGVPSCTRAAAIPSYCSQRYFDPRGVEK